jgi:hypothetical protein
MRTDTDKLIGWCLVALFAVAALAAIVVGIVYHGGTGVA